MEDETHFRIAKVVFLIGTILVIVGVIGHFRVDIQIKQDVGGWYEQSYSAADATQMAKWIDELLVGMENRGMTDGHYALFWKNPHNDMALDIEVFKALKERCHEVEKYPKGSMDYAESLEDIRRQMDKTGFDPTWWWVVNKAIWIYWFIIVGCLLWVVSTVEWFRGVAY